MPLPVPSSPPSVTARFQTAPLETGFFSALGAVAEETALTNPFMGARAAIINAFDDYTGIDPQYSIQAIAAGREAMAAIDERRAAERREAGAEWMGKQDAEDYIKSRGLNVDEFKISSAGADASVLMTQVAARERSLIRQYVAANGANGFIGGSAKLATGLIVSMADPVNMATGLIPGVNVAKWGGALKTASRAANIARRSAAGAIDAAIGTVITEPLSMLAAADQQIDYTVGDAALNLLFGSTFGAGAGAVFGAFGRIANETGGVATVNPARRQAVYGYNSPEALRDAMRVVLGNLDEDLDIDMRFFEAAHKANAAPRDLGEILSMRVAVDPSGTDARVLVLSNGEAIPFDVDYRTFLDADNLPPELQRRIQTAWLQTGDPQKVSSVAKAYFDELDEADTAAAAGLIGRDAPESLSTWFSKQDASGKDAMKRLKKAAIAEGFVPKSRAASLSDADFLRMIDQDEVAPRFFRRGELGKLERAKSALRDLRKQADKNRLLEERSFLETLRNSPESIKSQLLEYANSRFKEDRKWYNHEMVVRDAGQKVERAKLQAKLNDPAVDVTETAKLTQEADEIITGARQRLEAMKAAGLDTDMFLKTIDNDLQQVEAEAAMKTDAYTAAIQCVIGGAA